MLKLPTIDQLLIYGISAFSKRLKTKNPRKWYNIFGDGQNVFREIRKKSGDAKIFPRNTKMFLGLTKNLQGAKKNSGQWKKKIQALCYFRGTEKVIFGGLKMFPCKKYISGDWKSNLWRVKNVSAQKIYFRGQLFITWEYFPTWPILF